MERGHLQQCRCEFSAATSVPWLLLQLLVCSVALGVLVEFSGESLGSAGEVITLSLGPLSKQDLQDVQSKHTKGKHRFGWYWGCFLPLALVAAHRRTAHSSTFNGK